MAKVVVWRTGLLEIYDGETPSGAIVLGTGTRHRLTAILDGIARLSKPAKGQDPATFKPVWLCPGVPEATTSRNAMDSVISFQYQISERLAGHA